MGTVGAVLYLLFLLFVFVYYKQMVDQNYQKERPFGYGQDKTVHYIIVFCCALGQYTIPSPAGRVVVIFLFVFAFFLLFTSIGLRNKKDHTGELFLSYQKEVRRGKICTGVGMGIAFVVFLLLRLIE